MLGTVRKKGLRVVNDTNDLYYITGQRSSCLSKSLRPRWEVGQHRNKSDKLVSQQKYRLPSPGRWLSDATFKLNNMLMGASQRRKPFELPEQQAIERGADALGELVMFVLFGTAFAVIYKRETDEMQIEDDNKLLRISALETVRVRVSVRVRVRIWVRVRCRVKVRVSAVETIYAIALSFLACLSPAPESWSRRKCMSSGER